MSVSESCSECFSFCFSFGRMWQRLMTVHSGNRTYGLIMRKFMLWLLDECQQPWFGKRKQNMNKWKLKQNWKYLNQSGGANSLHVKDVMLIYVHARRKHFSCVCVYVWNMKKLVCISGRGEQKYILLPVTSSVLSEMKTAQWWVSDFILLLIRCSSGKHEETTEIIISSGFFH